MELDKYERLKTATYLSIVVYSPLTKSIRYVLLSVVGYAENIAKLLS